MPLPQGFRLGDYEITAPLGAGGMGEVYRATDHTLGRDVALKIVPASDPESIARFEREARAVAALSHPNILQVHRFGVESGVHYLVTELVSGQTLRSHIGGGRLSWREAAAIAAEICDGLAAAHAKGIIHRDLKPENVMLTSDGRVKILDFGLAKHDGAVTDDRTAVKTAPGTVMGTLTYMAPEQLRAEPVDATTDLFALGSILFEMISGRAPFARNSASDTMTAILRDDAPEPEDAPDELQAIVTRCLSKQKDLRFQSARDLGFDLRRVSGERPRRESRRTLALTLLGIAIIMALLAAWLRERGERGVPREVAATGKQESRTTLTQISFAKEVEQFPSWSPHATRIAFARETGGPRKIFIRSLADGAEKQLTSGTQDDIYPSWSPDGRTVLFIRSSRPGQLVSQADVYTNYVEGDIWSVDVESGKESILIRKGAEPAWSADGMRVAFSASFSGAPRIWIADRQGHNAQQVTGDTTEAVSHSRPSWSPDGKRIVFQTTTRNTQFDIRVIDLDTKRLHAITDDRILDVNPVWCPTGRYIYFSSYRGGGINVWRTAVEPNGGFAAQPEQVTTGAGQDLDVAIAKDGRRMAMATLRLNADVWRLPVTPEGTVTGPPQELIATTREESRGTWSRDGSSMAFCSDRAGEMNIWVRAVAGGADRQLTRGDGGDYQPDWSPDGSRITFFSRRGDSLDIWDADARTGALRQLTRAPSSETHSFYSPDGRQIAYLSDATGRLEVWLMNTDGSNPRQLTKTGVSIHFIRWSADGQHVSYLSLADAQPRLATMAVAGGEETFLKIERGGAHHSFSPDRKRIIDVRNHKTMWLGNVDTGEVTTIFEFDDPQVRIDYPVWSPDGKWVLFDRVRPEGGDIWMLEGL